ncbi:hypothetical protein V6N13_103151 [Hibiscus sabdariffa]
MVRVGSGRPFLCWRFLNRRRRANWKKYHVAISPEGIIRATDFKKITIVKDDKGLKIYDPGYLNIAPVRSSISYIDGDEGILRYRGYPIEELAESSSFLEVAYLLNWQNQLKSLMG